MSLTSLSTSRSSDPFKGLASSTREVDNALSLFLEERERACKAQADALQAYEAEMIHLNKEAEDEILRQRHEGPVKTVDHNILRSIKATGDEPGIYSPEEQGNFVSDQSLRKSSVQSVSASVKSEVSTGKKPHRTPAERTRIRKQMISFLDSCRDDEVDKFNELDELLGGNDPKKCVEVVESLYQEQTRNFDFLMKYLEEYQPEPFVKAWGNDPEYLALTKKYGMKSDQTFKARATLATMKHKRLQEQASFASQGSFSRQNSISRQGTFSKQKSFAS